MNLAELRQAKGLSQSQLAKLADVNIRNIQAYEIGARDIKKATFTIINKLCKALNCKFEDII